MSNPQQLVQKLWNYCNTRPSFWRANARLSDLNRLRAIGERQGDTIIWVWIGTHNEFDNLFG